ncbi:MAG: peptidoglycan-binding domain-containing protein [Candidatus Omnitrophica bacterium]|nr:peptidoglycan-binding domain-containing protein [Candidatus Omnitrophota bacterium]MDD5592239.1 peptidoglycan-binding domain-containing protein [Candidatus Omnitrophota bacterium]
MKKFVFIVLALVVSISLFSCAKKEQSLTEMQEPLSIEELGNQGYVSTPETTSKTATPAVTIVPVETKTELPLPPTTFKPTVEEIQTALKNSGYYTGLADGKKGPMTKKAIEDFQRANNLEVDGKVGPKTWALLSQHLNPASVSSTSKKKR